MECFYFREMLFAYFGGGMLGTPDIVQKSDHQVCFCWKLGACFDKTLFHRDLGIWQESLRTSKSELKGGLTKMSIYSLALGLIWHAQDPEDCLDRSINPFIFTFPSLESCDGKMSNHFHHTC